MPFSSPYSIKIDPDTAAAGQDDWRSVLERLEHTANPSRNMLKRLERGLAVARPQDVNSPEILDRLAKMTKLERRAKERIVLLAMEAFSSHGADERWSRTIRTVVSGEVGRGMLARRDERFVAIYAGMVENVAERCQDDAAREVERTLPLVREAKDLVRVVLQTHATKKDVARMLANDKRESLGDELVRRFGRFGRLVRAIGTLVTSPGASRALNAAVLAGFLTGLAPAKASARYDKVPTQTVSREAPKKAPDTKTTPTVKPAPVGQTQQSVNSKVSAEPVKIGPNGVTLKGDNGDTKVEAQAGSGLSMPTPTKPGEMMKQAPNKAPNSLAPAASVKITNGNIQANVEFLSRLRLQGADAETLWGVSAALAYMDSMQETGIAVKAAYDNKDGFKDLAARLGITVGEK
jgi:cytoskeletal protein RodZ